MTIPNLPSNLREFDDTAATRKFIHDGVLAAVQKRFPVEDDMHVLELKDAHYDGPLEYSLDQQKQALMKSRQLRTPIKGTWRLVDKKSGAVIDEREDVVMHVPYYTERGTFIHNGNEYSCVNQSRLKPGVYVRKQRTGEIESHFNVSPGTGKSFRLHLEPETGIMRINIDQSKIPVYPLLKTLGVTDQELMKTWGPDLVEANARKSDSRAVPKIYQRLSGYKFNPQASQEEQEAYLKESMPKFEVSPDVVARTLGVTGVTGVTPQLMLRATQKMLNVSKGEEHPDDRDAPMYSNIYGVEDLMRERIDKDAGRLTKSLMYKMRRSKNLQPVQRGALNAYMQSLILGSGLAMPLEETNPLHTLEQTARITKLGEGGIASAESVTDEARDVNNGQMGFIDGAAGPEGTNIGIDVRAAYKTFKGKDKQLYGEFREPRSGKEFYLKPEEVADKILAFPGQMKTPGDTAVAMVRGKIERVAKDKVDFEVPSMAHMMYSHSNLTPLPTGMMPTRSFYAAKYWSQYLPQAHGEIPYVDSLTPDGRETFAEHYGRKIGTLKSPVGGTVTRVNDTGITIRGDDGKVHNVETVKDFPFNRLTGISYYPTVKANDRVNVGDMVAHSNFTDKTTGALNMGVNLKAAIIPARGHSYEDAYTISESAAKKLTTDRLFGFDQEARHGVEISKNKFIATFPTPFSKAQVDSIGDDGVVKPGTVVNKGDPLIMAVGPKMLTSADAQLGKLHKVLRNAFTDKSVTWDYNFPGVVTDSATTASGARVNIKTQPPVQLADKLATRFSLKGVTGRIIPDDKMPRDLATNEPFEVLINPMGIQSRVAPAQIVEMALGKIAKATGKRFRLPQEPPPEGWSVWAKKQLDAAGLKEDTDIFDPESGKTIKGIGDGHVYVSAFHHIAEKKLSQRGESGAYTIDEQPAKGGVEGSKRYCFIAKQPIEVLGGEETIGHVVEKQLSLSAVTYDEFKGWTYEPITNWFTRSAAVEDIVQITVQHIPTTREGKQAIVHTDRCLWVTKNHELYLPDMSTIRAGDVKPGTWLAGQGYMINSVQQQVLLGSMLGDGSISGIPDDIPFYTEEHSIKQTDYLTWKRTVLGPLASNRSDTTDKHTGFKPGRVRYMTANRPDVIRWLCDICCAGNKKLVTDKWLTLLGDMALAVWVLDDGSFGNRSRKSGRVRLGGSIATMGFTAEECTKLVNVLHQRFGGAPSVQADRAIYLDHKTCSGLADVIAANVPAYAIPASKRWLKAYVTAHQLTTPSIPVMRPGIIPVRVRAVAPYVPDKPGVTTVPVYDITVDNTHRYMAGGILVSNSTMDVTAALAHGATEVVRDAMLIRGNKNEDYWKALKLGMPLPEPEVPFIYNKFLNTLKAGGINIADKGNTMSLLPMTDKDVDALSKGDISKPDLITSDFEPIPGGLFDVGKTGGMSGNRWTSIKLNEPVPNPVMEEPVRRVLGLKVKELHDIIAGRQELNGLTGGAAIQQALKNIDIDKAIEEQKQNVRLLRGANRDNAVKVIGYLTSAKKQGLHPADWVITKVPVLPPMFRPVTRMGDAALQTDLNELYRDLIETNNNINTLRKDLPENELHQEKGNLYDAVTAVYGLGDPITPEGQSKRLKGAIRQVIGTNPKTGLFQSKVLSKTVGNVARGVVTPNPNLDMDSAGLPADTAWTLYKDFVTRRLVRRGYPPVRALEMIDQRDPVAREMLDAEMQSRPVIMDRAPTWHKYNLMAFFPHIVEGHTFRVNPLITKGYNMDFDGDQANFHVPVSDKAVEQALQRMMPSKNLVSLTDLRSVRHAPSMEMTMGLYQLTQPANKKPPQVFKTAKEARHAYEDGLIGANDPIIIQDR